MINLTTLLFRLRLENLLRYLEKKLTKNSVKKVKKKYYLYFCYSLNWCIQFLKIILWKHFNVFFLSGKSVIQSERVQLQETSENKEFQCNQCNFVASCLRRLYTHKRRIHKGIIYRCDECNYVSNRGGSLKLHKSSVHRQGRYPCDQCDHVFVSVRGRRTHMKTHKPQLLLCDRCTYSCKEWFQ